MKTSEFVKNLLKKAGVAHEGEIGDEIPDEVATSADNALLTIAAATNNHPQVKKVYFAQAYNGLDAELNDIITEFGIPDDVKAEIEKAGGTTKRATALIRKIKELSAKDQPADKGKAAELQAEINKLHGQLKAELESKEKLQKDFDNNLKQIKIQTKLGGLKSAYKTSYDDLPAEAKDAAMDALLAKALQDSDADFTFDEKGNLALVKKDGTNLFGENHTLVTPQAFLDKTFSKILKVSSGQNGNIQPTTQAPTVQGGQNGKNAALDAAIDESLQNYQAATKSAVAI